mgnify:CR=1 FL=1
MKFIDLFAGAGGMSLGFKRSGAELVFANEYDINAATTLKHNMYKLGEIDPEEKVLVAPIQLLNETVLDLKINDLPLGLKVANVNVANQALKRNLKGAEIEKLRQLKQKLIAQSVDVIVGGPPCQGFSTVGRGKRGTKEDRLNQFVDDPRNTLFKHFLGVVEYYKPKVVLIENVKGLLSAMSYSDQIIDSISSLDYYIDSKPLVLRSVDFGIPQNRERVFFVGFLKSYFNPTDDICEQFQSELNQFKVSESDKTVLSDAIFDLPKISANHSKNNLSIQNEIPIGDPRSFGETVSKMKYSEIVNMSEQSEYVKTINGPNFYHTLKDHKLHNHKSRFQNDRDLKIFKLLAQGKYMDHKYNKEAKALCEYDTTNFKDKYFKLAYSKPSKTIVAHLSSDNNSFVHPGRNPRGITPREAARIQSFPDWYEFKGSLASQFRQIGNAVPPLLAQYLAKSIQKVIKYQTKSDLPIKGF